jgi:hypothetical protein
MARSLSALAVVETLVPATDEDARLAALQRLYLRRETVDELIRSLELFQIYEKCGGRGPAPCIPINASPKWS